MTEHPITPPPELVGQWLCSEDYLCGPLEQASITIATSRLQNVATLAARWGADQELEACCEYMQHEDFHGFAKELRAVRRPKPPSLKEQALAILDVAHRDVLVDEEIATIRRALEQVDD